MSLPLAGTQAKRRLSPVVLLFVGLFLLGLAILLLQRPVERIRPDWRGPHVTSDGWYYYMNLCSLVLDGDLDLTNEYREIGNWYGFKPTRTGRPGNPFGVGPALLWAPAFVVGQGLARIDANSARYPRCMSPQAQTATLLVSYLAAFAALLLAYRFCRRYYAPLPALLGALGASLGGPLLWYGIYEPAMPHALDALAVTGFLYLALPLRRRTLRQACWLGLLAGCAILVRPQNAVVLFVPGVEALVLAWAARHEGLRGLARPLIPLGITVAVAAVLFTPQLLAWQAIYGHWLVVPQGQGFMRLGASLWSETLFSSRNGLFTYTPLLWLVMPGLVLCIRRQRALGLLLGLLLLIYAWINGAAWDWWAGGAYGGRRFTCCTLVFAAGLAALADALSSAQLARRAMVGVLFGVFFAYQASFLHAYKVKRIRWDEPGPFDEKVRAAIGWAPSALYRIIGNPFALPANLGFALRHGVPLARYDSAVGPYLLDERVPTTNPLRRSKREERVPLIGRAGLPYLGHGLMMAGCGAAQDGAKGELLVPLNRPGRLRLVLELGAAPRGPLSLAWNGEPLAVQSGNADDRRLAIAVDARLVRRGINVLSVTRTWSDRICYSGLVLLEGSDWPPRWATEGP